MKDIKIRVTNKMFNLAVIDHTIYLGYKANETTAAYLLDADYFLVAHNQPVRWCLEDIFNTADSYEEMTDIEFIKYGGED
jgi:hypothetical protein